ncbi:phage tail protein [Citrobacter freundii]|nr:phage tail protein [Citrobacter freundii]MBC6508292.1 phage tail protein [Citrobacter freundii]
MAGKLSTEIQINLAGNLQAKSRQYGSNMSDFASRNKKAMLLVKASTESALRGIDTLGNRYTGMIAGIGSSLTVKQVADFDAQMRRMGTDAQLTTEQVKTLHEGIRDVSNQKDIRIEASSLAQGASELLGKTGDYEYVQENLRNMGLLMQAFGVDGQTAAGLMAQFWEKGVKGSEDVSKMLDKLYAQFAVGSVSVADIAKVAPKLFSIVNDQGPVAIAQMGAFAQVFAKSKGGIDDTVTSIQAMYASLSNKQNIAFLKKNGIDVFQKGTKDLKLPFELMKEIINRAKNDPIKLQDVFDQTGMQGIKTLLKPENIQLMEQLIYGTAEIGSTQNAAKTNADSFNSSIQALNNEWQKFAESNLAKPVQDLADALNSVDSKTVQNWLEVGKYTAMVLGGIVVARKSYQFGKTIHDIMNPGKGKGLPKGVTDVFGSGVMPVYVVNMGAGGMGGASGAGLPDAGGNNGGRPGSSRFGNAMRWGGKVLGIAGAGYEVYDHLQGQYQLYDRVGELTSNVANNPDASPAERAFAEESQRNQAKLESLWNRVTDFFTSASENPAITGPSPAHPYLTAPAIQPSASSYPAAPALQGEIRVVVEGDARVKSVRMDQPGIRLSAQAGVSSVEQD